MKEKIEHVCKKRSLLFIGSIIFLILIISYFTINEFKFLKDKQFYLDIMNNLSKPETKVNVTSLFDREYNYTELLKWLHARLNYTEEKINRYTEPLKILEYGKGKCQEFAIVYVALCLAHGYESRLVIGWFGNYMWSRETHAWSEVKIQNEWIHIDPTEKRIDDPTTYVRTRNEGGWGRTIRYVYAFGIGELEDVTPKYKK